MNNIESNMKNNDILIESLENNMKNTIEEEKVQVLSDTIEDLKYQNETNEEIMKLLNEQAVKEFRNER